MAIKKGTSDLGAAYIGSNSVSKIYLGNTQLFPVTGGGSGGHWRHATTGGLGDVWRVCWCHR